MLAFFATMGWLVLVASGCQQNASPPKAGNGNSVGQHANGTSEPTTQPAVITAKGDTSAADTSAPERSSDSETVLQPPSSTSWPSFRNGPLQLGVSGSTLAEQPVLLWKHPVDYGVVTSAAIVGEHVYVGALSGFFFCLGRDTGDVVWKYRSIESTDPEDFAPGFISPPTVTEDSVYVGDEDGVFHAIERGSGEQRWTFPTAAEIPGGAAIVGEHVIIGSHDSKLYCLNAADGSKVWDFETLDRINCSPAIAENHTFVAGCDEHLRVINVADAEQIADIPLGSYLIASPAIVGDMLYVGTYASEVLAVNWKTKEIIWRYSDPKRELPYHASASVTDRYVLAGGRDKQMHCIDRESGEGIWTFPTRGKIDSSPAVVGDRVYFGSSDRNIYGVSIDNGEEVWKYNTGSDVTAGIAVGEGVLVAGSEGNPAFVYCFGEKPAEE